MVIDCTDGIKSMLTRIVELAHGPVRVLEAGHGRPVVLLHAFPLSADLWRPVLESPPEGLWLAAPDLRGFRGPDGPAAAGPLDAVTIDDYAADVVALLDRLSIDRAGVAGVSMGGYVALALYRQAASRLTGLWLINTRAGADTPEQREGRDRMAELARREGAAAVAREMLPKLVGETAAREQPDEVRRLGALIEANSPEAIAAALGALKTRPDSSSLLPTITCPATIVHGEEDAIIPRAEADALHRGIAGSRLATVPGMGHVDGIAAIAPHLS
jgi:pimeloyl-ACP methyl ester carboxylesterase